MKSKKKYKCKHGHSAGGSLTPTGATPQIHVHARWRRTHGFENFLADMGERIPGTTLGRYLDLGDYSKANCAWQSRTEQGAERCAHTAVEAWHQRREVHRQTRYVWRKRLGIKKAAQVRTAR